MPNEIINKAINYIIENLGEDLTVEQIAEHCHFSKFYFNRLFKSVVGESVYAFIKRLRIEKSALQISVAQKKTITEIGNSFGYSSSNFSTAFKKRYGKSPHEFKCIRRNNKIRFNKDFFVDLSKTSYEFINKNIRLEYLPDTEVVYQRFIGHYHNLKRYWTEFFDSHKQYIDETSAFYEISYDDPILTNPDRCITDIAICTSKPLTKNCLTMVIKGGKYAAYTYVGPNTKIFEAFQGILGIWLPNSNYEADLRKRKVIAKYNFAEIENNHYSLDIYIPII